MKAHRVVPFMIIGIVVLATRWPVFGSWWCLDDWGQLTRAAGLTPAAAGFPARWLSQHVYWTMTWPLLGMDFVSHAAVRLILHATAACSVHAIARGTGLDRPRSLAAALLFAASPLAFTPLVWASGIQELMAGSFALAAMALWLQGRRWSIVSAGVLLSASVLSKETGLALPAVLLVGTFVTRNRTLLRWRVTTAAATLAMACLEAWLVTHHFTTGEGDPYRLGGISSWAGNLGMFGWWMLTPGPFPSAQPTWPMAAAGWAFWILWLAGGCAAARRGSRWILIALVVAIASLLPALPLFSQTRPYMAYGAVAAGCVALLHFIPGSWLGRPVPRMLVMATIVFWGAVSHGVRAKRHDSDGVPLDPVVRAAALSQATVARLQTIDPSVPLVVYQQPLREAGLARVQRHGPASVLETRRYQVVGGATGISLALGGTDVRWRASLAGVPQEARVFAESGSAIEDWGMRDEALVRAAVVDLYIGFWSQAMAKIESAAVAGFDPVRMDRTPLGTDMTPDFLLHTQADRFRRWLLNQATAGTVGMERYRVVRRYFDRLMSRVDSGAP